MSTDEYPFGVAPRDAFDVGHCPSCRADVGPRLHYCRSCFASYDLNAAKDDLLSASGVRTARLVQPALVMIGVLVCALSVLDMAPPILFASAGGMLVAYGLLSWGLFARQPAVFSAVSALVFFGLAVVVALGGSLMQAIWPGPRRLGVSIIGFVALAFGALGMLSARGVRTGLDARRLHKVERPTALVSESYR